MLVQDKIRVVTKSTSEADVGGVFLLNGEHRISILILAPPAPSTALSELPHSPLNFLSVLLLCPPFPHIHPETIATFLSVPLSLLPLFKRRNLSTFCFQEKKITVFFLTECSNCLFLSVTTNMKFLWIGTIQAGFDFKLLLEEYFSYQQRDSAEWNNPNSLLSDSCSIPPCQLCNYGVQAWSRTWARNKLYVFIRERLMRSTA